jgi:cellulose synthase/poly-beta-1,6-N-acetylglucosamine synthase-like glycosyltransferase
MQQEYNYTPLPEPIPINEQVWPEGTLPLVCTSTLAYNHEPYIRECLDGILMQKTTFPVQVFTHEDSSTDKTAETLKEYRAKYPNLIKITYQPENVYLLKDIVEKKEKKIFIIGIENKYFTPVLFMKLK